ncbi:hypothetical protein N1E91_11695 [Pseudomonas aeruginosa]|nr:hypothetical protein [Pseudomonas aeruginosa]MCS9139110.1 hypothetical protein [Pseudomonas aeruginosa]MCS9211909.1 hypothetical protein [Pseudomonas aeruginosa]
MTHLQLDRHRICIQRPPDNKAGGFTDHRFFAQDERPERGSQHEVADSNARAVLQEGKHSALVSTVRQCEHATIPALAYTKGYFAASKKWARRAKSGQFEIKGDIQ